MFSERRGIHCTLYTAIFTTEILFNATAIGKEHILSDHPEKWLDYWL